MWRQCPCYGAGVLAGLAPPQNLSFLPLSAGLSGPSRGDAVRLCECHPDGNRSLSVLWVCDSMSGGGSVTSLRFLQASSGLNDHHQFPVSESLSRCFCLFYDRALCSALTHPWKHATVARDGRRGYQKARRAWELLLWGLWEISAPHLSPKFWWLPAIIGISWLGDTWPDLCFVCHSVFSLCVSVSKFLRSYKTTSLWMRTHANPLWPHFNFITSAKTLST